MKLKSALVVTVVALFTTIALPQYAPRNGGPGQSGTAPDPATLIANRVAFLKALLTLTDAQAANATTIFTNELAAETTVRTSLDTAHTSLQDAIKSNNTAQIDTLATQIGTLEGQVTSINAKADAAFYALLTADQKTKYDALGSGGGPGGPGRGPGH